MNTAEIDKAFRIKVRQVLGSGARIVFENDVATNVVKPYFKAFHLPAETQTPTFGTGGIQRAVGIYQISVITDAGVGSAEAATYVDQLLNSFTRGLTLSSGGVIITVEKSWRSPAVPSVDSYMIPVSVRYWSDN